MTILDTFYILFESDSKKLDKGLEESDKKAKGLVENLKGVDSAGMKAGDALFGMIGKAAGLLGVGLSIGALFKGIKDTAESYTQLERLALQFRSTADAVDQFRDAAGLLGITEETSVGALKSLESAVQDTFLGMGRAKKVFEELGITVTDAAGKIKPTTQVMNDLSEKFKDMDRGTQIRVMERLGLDPALLKLFNSDLAGLQKRMAEVDKASGFDLDRAVKRSAEYTKAMKGLKLEVNTLTMYLGKLTERFSIDRLPMFTKGIETATKYVKMFVDYLLKHSNFVEGFVIAIAAAISYFLIPAAIKGALAVWAMIAPFVLIGLAVAAAATAFALIYDDIMNFIDGNDSLIGQIMNDYPGIAAVIRGIGAAFKAVWDIAAQVMEFFVSMWVNPTQAFRQFLQFVFDGLNKLIGLIPGLSSLLSSLGVNFSISAAGAKTGNPVQEGVRRAQGAYGMEANSLLGSQTSTSIGASSRVRNSSVNIGKVEVQTQATDAAGISKAIGGSMQNQMRQAVNNFDDGVLA